MKPFRFLAPVAASFLLLAGCGQSDSAPLAAGVKPYPLDKCPVSDEKLGAMGDPVVFVHQGQQIKLCCKSCRKDFEAEPAKYLAKLTGK
jgi:hypothetical protein